jgi:hypothetical protein
MLVSVVSRREPKMLRGSSCSEHRSFRFLNELEQRLLAFQRRYEETASPFQWTFTRKDLATLLAKIENKRFAPAA